jgi:hypothetical protein
MPECRIESGMTIHWLRMITATGASGDGAAAPGLRGSTHTGASTGDVGLGWMIVYCGAGFEYWGGGGE